jgi:dTDP-glucose 4,6-dehydratase
MQNKTLVIGSNSFSGQDFVRHALEQGDKVFCASRSKEKPQELLGYNKKDVIFSRFDINNYSRQLATWICTEKMNRIINFAAQSIVAESWENPDHWYNTNVVAQAKLFKHLANMDFIDRYVQVSTPEVYGSTEGRIVPSHNYNPSTPYAASKAAGDTFISMYSKQFDIPISFVRSSNVYGIYQQYFKIVPKCILSILFGKKLPLHGGGYSTRDFINIKDVSRAEYIVLSDSRTISNNEVFHISTESEISICNLIRMICNELNADFNKAVEIVDDRPGKDSAYILDSALTRRAGWQPKIDLKEGIREVIGWLDKYTVLPNLEYEHKE